MEPLQLRAKAGMRQTFVVEKKRVDEPFAVAGQPSGAQATPPVVTAARLGKLMTSSGTSVFPLVLMSAVKQDSAVGSRITQPFVLFTHELGFKSGFIGV